MIRFLKISALVLVLFSCTTKERINISNNFINEARSITFVKSNLTTKDKESDLIEGDTLFLFTPTSKSIVLSKEEANQVLKIIKNSSCFEYLGYDKCGTSVDYGYFLIYNDSEELIEVIGIDCRGNSFYSVSDYLDSTGGTIKGVCKSEMIKLLNSIETRGDI